MVALFEVQITASHEWHHKYQSTNLELSLLILLTGYMIYYFGQAPKRLLSYTRLQKSSQFPCNSRRHSVKTPVHCSYNLDVRIKSVFDHTSNEQANACCGDVSAVKSTCGKAKAKRFFVGETKFGVDEKIFQKVWQIQRLG